MTSPDFRAWLTSLAEAEATVPARVVLERLPDDQHEDTPDRAPLSPPAELTWRERLWIVPAETRLGKAEVLEAMGKSESWLYHRTGAAAEHRIPHAKLDGVLVFRAGELRAWLRDSEEEVRGGRVDSAPIDHIGPGLRAS